MKELKALCQEILDLIKEVECLKREKENTSKFISNLEAENRRLKYEYNDSLLKRDKALPYKWKRQNGILFQLCPKCEIMISNWQGYCHACGQKIKQGNPLPENEIKETPDETN